MPGIPGYRISQELYASANALVYRARRAADDQPVILKLLNQDFPSPERIAWFVREYDVLRNLHLPGVVAVYSLEYNQQRPMMVLEDFGGESLHRLRLAGTLDLADTLRLAIGVAEILGQVHQHQIMHKDVNPSNIVLNVATGQVKLIDFGISTVLSRETPAFRNPNVLEGTLAYLSPEQTGRMNRDMDYRTDFYSFGVTLYELLTGRLPFASDDPLELVHSHIAKLPPPPHAGNPDLPAAVSAIVLKLLAKNAEDRYQSAHGIVADLRECLRQWQAGRRIEPFVLGRSDRSDKLYIPQKLYGRQQEIAGLLAAFDRVGGGASELLLVAGYAGVGKSALVHELYKPISARRAYFIAGKFDQLQRTIPYSALIQALRSLIQQLLTESAAAIAAWRDALLAVLGPNGQVIVDVIPEVDLIIGPQPAPARLDAVEAQHRFRLVFQNFIKVFARPMHALVLFLDDLQWADGASLELLAALMTAPDRGSMLVLGAYRDNEVSDTHPLMLTLAEIVDAGATVGRITLAPLDLAHTAELIADTLHQSCDTVLPLAELIQRKTEGNPFFVNEFLKSLYVAGLLTYAHATDAAGGGHWRWDVARIQERDITDNVVELLAGKVQTLPAATQRLVQLAACIGNQFDLATLAVVSEQAIDVAADDVWPAVVEGLLVPIGDAYKLASSPLEDVYLPGIGEQARYLFAHDRVQQAVYSLIPGADRDAIHWCVGQLMLRSTPPDQREAQIFALVAQLNHGVALLATQAERDELASLNLLAARKAKLSAAYQPAFAYARVGCELLEDGAWQRRYDLALDLYTEAAETAYLSGDHAGMARLVEIVLRQATSLLDTIKAYEVLLRAHHSLEAAPIAFDVLRQLGVTFPPDPSRADLLCGLADIQEALAGRPIADLIDLPHMTDPIALAALHIMSTASTAVYTVAPRVFPLYVLKQVALSIAHGNAPQSPYSYALYGLILCGVVGDLDTAYQWGQLGLQLVDALDATQFRAKTLFTALAFINHWKVHVHDTLALGRAAYQSGLETGDIEFVGLACVAYSAYAYHSGKPLPQLEREIAAYTETIASLKHETSVYRLYAYRQTILNMLGQSNDVSHLHGDIYDARRMLPLHIERRDGITACAIYINHLILSYLFHNYAEAIENADLAEQLVDLVIGQMLVPIFYFHDSLARLAVYADASEEQRARILEKVGANQAKLENWATHAPMNYRHKWHLVEAERTRVLGCSGEAREQYDQAIALAERHGYLNEAALAHELAGRFYLDKGLAQFAEVCLHNACYAYGRWGALAKVRDIETRYRHMFAQTALAGDTTWISTDAHGTTGRTAGSALDVISVVKASQAISSEIVLHRLLQTLMKIAIENAGAQQGYLLLAKHDSFVIAAIGTVDQDNAVVLQSSPLAALSEIAEPVLPLAIINYVARTHESVVLHDAADAGQFTQDAYIARTRPRSVLCAPLLNGGRLTGILYLENNLTTGAFTADRLEVLKLLAAQTAISIENAGLYANLEQSERKYRALFEDSRDTIFISGPAGEILDINPAGVSLFGYPKAELLHMHTVDLYADPDDRRRLIAAAAIDGAVHDFETTLRAADGTTIECLISATVRLAEDGTSLGFQGIIRDVTERRRIQREREQLLALQRELDVARHIQSSLLPPTQIAWPDLDAVCYNAPAREVSGDFYAYRTQSSSQGRRFVFALGDVTGKGMPAALLMAISMTSFQAILPQSRDPGDLLRRLDQAIARYTRTSRQNCALVYADITPTGGQQRPGRATMRAANAGGVPPLIRRASGAVEWVNVGGMPLGTELGAELGYPATTSQLASGDMVILTSDGVIEAMNPAGELFGFARLEQAAASGPADSAEAMLGHLRTVVDTFGAGDEPHDDVTIVIVRV